MHRSVPAWAIYRIHNPCVRRGCWLSQLGSQSSNSSVFSRRFLWAGTTLVLVQLCGVDEKVSKGKVQHSGRSSGGHSFRYCCKFCRSPLYSQTFKSPRPGSRAKKPGIEIPGLNIDASHPGRKRPAFSCQRWFVGLWVSHGRHVWTGRISRGIQHQKPLPLAGGRPSPTTLLALHGSRRGRSWFHTACFWWHRRPYAFAL